MLAHEKKDTLHLHMAIDTITLLKSYITKKDSTTFKLTDFQNKKENSERFTSPSFYTGPRGYHMEIRIYPNGNDIGEGTHLSVFVHFIDGNYNDVLKWPFVGVIKFELLNQIEDSNHCERELDIKADNKIEARSDSAAFGYPEFISHSDLTSKPYLRDNTLYFRVSVEIADHTPWLECTVEETKTLKTVYH